MDNIARAWHEVLLNTLPNGFAVVKCESYVMSGLCIYCKKYCNKCKVIICVLSIPTKLGSSRNGLKICIFRNLDFGFWYSVPIIFLL